MGAAEKPEGVGLRRVAAASFFEERLDDFERVLKAEPVEARARVVANELQKLSQMSW